MVRASLSLVTVLAAVSFANPAFAQSDEDKLGKVHFETSCNAEAQKLFDRGMLYQHSFWYRASQKMFEDTLKADPACSIAYWGIALSLLWNPHTAPPVKNLAEGAAAIEKARAIGFKTEREQAYVDALAAMYTNYETLDHRTRLLAYAKAMEALAQRYPDDDEAQIHYALALNTSASPADKTYANQLKGAAILETIALRQPMHPGVAHYLIHLYDYPAIADKGIEAARRYAKIAPDAPHALHMPSHIFTRVGYWNDSIASNVASARSAKETGDLSDELHAMDYLVYAYLQLGQDDKAKAVIDEMKSVAGFSESFIAGPYAEAASPARYALERGDWKAAEDLTVRPSPQANAQAITYFARALGAARAGDPEAAKADIAKLGELRDKLRAAKDAYWTEQVDIQAKIASAWVLYAEGKKDDALKAMSDAADAEDRTEKHPVTPGVPKPARELYGEMLRDSGNAKDALTAFEATLKKEPNRLGAYAGAARAAEQLGDAAKARQYFSKIVEQAGSEGNTRSEVADARAYLAGH
ncbi:tetratricopeptide repeat protein [Bradyrhizobium sp. Tv2a-2]|uniref:tetratricopeptide repeat protein n=1 Tax=Bradyrhizobium sp. Tv2a-2 TaxID=113395 RepID=UPI000415E4A8|nr:tetratricopeptide repeat protein [Bradyrhizobium sp. Tv2a-2]